MKTNIKSLCLGFVLGSLAFGSTAVAQTSGTEDIPQEVLVNYSLSAESFKNGQYADARPYLRWLLNNAPTVYNGERIHERAYQTYTELAKTAEEEARKTALLDTALQIMDSAVPTIKEAGKDINEQAWYIQTGNYIRENADLFNATGLDVNEKTTDLYRAAFDLDPENFDAYYARLIPYGYGAQGKKQEAVEFMDLAEPYYEDDAELVGYFDSIRNSLFRSPAERMAFLEDRLEKNPEDLEIVTELFDLYRSAGNTEKMAEIGDKLMSMDPSPRVYRLLAEVRYDNGDYQGAIELYNQALEHVEGDEERRDLLYNRSLVYYEMEGNLPRARQDAEAALQLDDSFGAADILLGDIYAKAVQGSEHDRRDKAVYWLAVDHYERAARRDRSLASRANQKAGQYRSFFPNQEEKFFMNWTAGQSYQVDYGRYSWINRSTTVR